MKANEEEVIGERNEYRCADDFIDTSDQESSSAVVLTYAAPKILRHVLKRRLFINVRAKNKIYQVILFNYEMVIVTENKK